MRHLAHMAVLVIAGAMLSACWGQTSTEPPIVPIRNMHEQARYDSQERSTFFDDHRTMRPPVEGTVSREAEADLSVDTGVDTEGQYVLTIPDAVVSDAGGLHELAARGQGRYEIFCTPCHDSLGQGNGMVRRVGRGTLGGAPGAMAPPTLHEARMRTMPDGQLYATIRNGFGNMPAYNHNVPVRDRWAIVAYVRALQVSQLPARRAALTPQRIDADTEVTR